MKYGSSAVGLSEDGALGGFFIYNFFVPIDFRVVFRVAEDHYVRLNNVIAPQGGCKVGMACGKPFKLKKVLVLLKPRN